MEDVDKIDNIQDGFSSTTSSFAFAKLPVFSTSTARLTSNQNCLQQQHVGWMISNALLKKGTREAYKTWTQDRAWVDMRLHESHDEGGFGVSNNTITCHAASYTTNARFVAFLGTLSHAAQQVWLPGNDIQDPTTWDAPPLCTLKRLHGDLLQQYDCTEQAAPQPPPPSAGGGPAANAGAHPQPPAGSQDNSNGKLLLQQLDSLHLAFKRRQVSPSAPSSSQDQQAQQPPKSVIPSHRRITEQLTKHWAPFKVLRQLYAGMRLEEQRQLHLPQKHKATVPDSTLRVEMNNLEEQADTAKARELFWKPHSWLGAIRPTSANDAFDPTFWETFVSTTLGLEVPILAAFPHLHNSPHAKCGCKKFCMDFHGDHTSTCTAHATKAHDWMVSVLANFTAAGMSSETNNSEALRFKGAAFYNSLKSKVGLAAAKAAALRINLNVQGCDIVATPMYASSRTPGPFCSPSFFHTISLSPAFTSA